MWLWSCLGTHAGFACLYTCWAQVLDTGRAGVLLVVCVHQLASSGVQKLRLGGWCGWAHPETMAQTLRFSLQVPNYDTHPCSNKTPTRTQTRVPSAQKLTRVLVLQELNKPNTQYRIQPVRLRVAAIAGARVRVRGRTRHGRWRGTTQRHVWRHRLGVCAAPCSRAARVPTEIDPNVRPTTRPI